MWHACADGLGIAVDAPYSKELQRLLSEAFAAKKVVAAVGRGVAALLSAKITDPNHPQAGMPIVYGKQVPDRASPVFHPPHDDSPQPGCLDRPGSIPESNLSHGSSEPTELRGLCLCLA